ncbi:MAG: DUF1761 domain-containing protein [Saprospiraceae bacterium]
MNWPAIVVATLIPTIVGAIWYNPKVLGNYWLRANNTTAEAMRGGNMPLIYVAALALSFFLAMFVHQNVTGPGQEAERFGTFQHGMVHGTALILFIVLPILGTSALFERRGWNWLLVNVGYWWITLMIMGGILSLWR